MNQFFKSLARETVRDAQSSSAKTESHLSDAEMNFSSSSSSEWYSSGSSASGSDSLGSVLSTVFGSIL